jgi:putative iron-dependent peroxidase
MSLTFQPSILKPTPESGRSVSYGVRFESDPAQALRRLAEGFDPAWGVVAFGEPLALALGKKIPGLRMFPAMASGAATIPSNQHALWIFLRGASRGEIFDLSQKVAALIDESFELADAIDTFTYAGGRDLTGYEDGTENPGPDRRTGVAIAGVDSPTPFSSFVAVQRWAHDLARFNAHSQDHRDNMIGRRLKDNAELPDAPASSHVKRTAQESFDPEAFMWRRSQPWASNEGQGLEFIAYGASLDPFERMMERMAGLEDGIADALFTFSRPVNGGCYWCPPLKGGRLDLSLLGL